MLRNFILIALRNFRRQKLFSFLNMTGLALGLASSILIFLYVSDELRYDTIHPHYSNTYRIGATWSNSDGRTFDNTESPGFWVKQLKDSRTEVEQAVRIAYIGYPTSLNYKAKEKIILTEEIKWAEPGFDKVLKFDLLQGNKAKIFEHNNSMVVSETGARRIFGRENPIGKTITVKHFWATRDREIDVMVTGLYKDYPSNSHFKPLYLLNVNALRAIHADFSQFMEGSRFGENTGFFENYLVMKDGADTRPVEGTLNALAKQMMESDSAGVAAGWQFKPFLTKMADMHFDQKNLWEYGIRGDKKYLAIFSSIAFLIILIACINYMNLATARSAKRAKEVGLRKSLGSNRREIAKQFFLESLLTTICSLVLALLLVIAFLQPFNQLADKTFTVGSLFDPYMFAIVAGIVLFMAFLSGSYPAFYLSKFKPVEVLKGQLIRGKGAEFFRKSLVTLQYFVSLVLIICTFIAIRQMNHMQRTKLNEAGSQLLSIRYGGIAPQEKFMTFKQAVLQDKDIDHVTMANHLPRLNYFGWIGAHIKFPEFSEAELDWSQLNVDFDFPKTCQLEFIAGRDFQQGNTADSASMILNEAAVKALNQPLDKIMGTTIRFPFDSSRSFKVIGIVKDFPYRSMHQPIEPLLLNPNLHFIDKIAYVKIPPGKFSEKMEFVEKKWKEVFPNIGFDHWFLNDEFNRMYLVEKRVSALGKVFALLAILITVLGVFGLASYTAEQKTKEVGIRKELGADVKQITRMFLTLFVKIFLVASLIAIPAAYFASYKWLQDFAYKTSISPLVFISSLMGLLVITLVTVGYEVWKSAVANPVVSLRTE
ncbi:MAG TPA: FtsX-like permease family protein [Chitinophagaceae bacterium]|nr:FtsX-like permease family protein [Chitinophagaceae bacterium]